jgi:hypothetical protein
VEKGTKCSSLKFKSPYILIKHDESKILGILCTRKRRRAKLTEKTDKTTITERERYKGKMDKARNKARAAEGKDRAKKAGHEPVSDQKSHEYH